MPKLSKPKPKPLSEVFAELERLESPGGLKPIHEVLGDLNRAQKHLQRAKREIEARQNEMADLDYGGRNGLQAAVVCMVGAAWKLLDDAEMAIRSEVAHG